MSRLTITVAIVLAFFALGAGAANAEDPVDSVYDWCPNLDWAYSPYDAFLQTGVKYEMKWSNRYGAYICVQQR